MLRQNYTNLGLCVDVNRIPTRLEALQEQQAQDQNDIERKEHVMKKRLAKGKSAFNAAEGKLVPSTCNEACMLFICCIMKLQEKEMRRHVVA